MEFISGSIKVFARNEWIYYYYSKIKSVAQKYIDDTFEATMIVDNLWLGAISSACNREALHKHNIETIISAVLGSTANFPYDFNYERAKLRDVEDENILDDLDRLVPIINRDLVNGRPVLVHCHFGRSRSASIVAAYLIRHHNMTVEEAIEFLQKKRSQVSINDGYVQQLHLYEAKVFQEKQQKKIN